VTFLLHQDAAQADIIAERFARLSSACATRPLSDRKLIAATTLVGVAQAPYQQGHDVPIDVRMAFRDGFE